MRDLAARCLPPRLVAMAVAIALLLPLGATPAAAADGDAVTLTGTLRTVIADDFEGGRSETRHSLETPDGPVPLVVRGDGAPELGGTQLSVTGTRRADGSVLVDAVEPLAGLPEAGAGTGADADATAEAVYGWEGPSVRRVALVIGSYTDKTAPASPAMGEEAMDGIGASVRTMIEASSRGQVTVETTVLGPWPLGISSCPSSNAFDRTEAAVRRRADAAGISLARYDHVVMWTRAPCESYWTALGEAPGSWIHVSAPYPDGALSREDEFANVVTHEMGHNMGLLHANGMACTGHVGQPVAISGACDPVAYGDPFSTMGGDQGWQDPATGEIQFLSPLFDSSELAHLGWLEPTEEQLVTTPGSYSLVSTYADAPGVRLLRIRRTSAPVSTDPSMGYPLGSGWLTVELRAQPPPGPWERLVPGSPARAGVIVRYVADGYDHSRFGWLPALGTSFLVDTVPETVGVRMEDNEFHDAPLTVGRTFTDAISGTQITLTSLDAAGASVSVAFPGDPPPAAGTIAPPTISSVTTSDGAATVTWTGGSTAGDGHTVRSYPGGLQCAWFVRWGGPQRCTVEGLANGTSYRFTVTAASAANRWQTSLPSAAVVPVGPPTARVLALPAYRTSPSIHVTWDGQDDGGPVDSYDVRYRSAPWNGTYGAYATWQSSTTATTATLAGSPGRTYCFSARSRNDGVTGGWSAEACTAVPLDDRSLKRSSGWSAITGSSFFQGTAIRTSRQGASLVRTNVVAQRVALVATTCSTCGSVRVYWNGSYKRTVSLRSGTAAHRVLIPLLAFSSPKSGTLRLVVSTSTKRVQVDGVAISRR